MAKTECWILTSLGDLIFEDEFNDYVQEDQDYEFHDIPEGLDEDQALTFILKEKLKT